MGGVTSALAAQSTWKSQSTFFCVQRSVGWATAFVGGRCTVHLTSSNTNPIISFLELKLPSPCASFSTEIGSLPSSCFVTNVGGGELHGCRELLPVGWWGCARHPWIGWLHNRSCPHTLEGAWWVSALSTLSSGVRAWSHPSSQFQSLPTQRLEDIGFQPLRYVGKGPCRQWEDDVNRQEEVGVRERGCGTKQCLVVSLSTWQG